MFGFLGNHDKLPSSSKNRFIPLLLPKLDIKGTVRESIFDKSRFPDLTFRSFHSLGSARALQCLA